MGSYTFMEGGYPGAAVAGADAQNHGSTVRRSIQLRRSVAAGTYTSRTITTETDELLGLQTCSAEIGGYKKKISTAPYPSHSGSDRLHRVRSGWFGPGVSITFH